MPDQENRILAENLARIEAKLDYIIDSLCFDDEEKITHTLDGETIQVNQSDAESL